MKLRVLSDKETEQVTGDVLEAQARLTLKQVVEWGDILCKDEWHDERHWHRMTSKHECPECWQSLKELAEEK